MTEVLYEQAGTCGAGGSAAAADDGAQAEELSALLVHNARQAGM